MHILDLHVIYAGLQGVLRCKEPFTLTVHSQHRTILLSNYFGDKIIIILFSTQSSWEIKSK